MRADLKLSRAIRPGRGHPRNLWWLPGSTSVTVLWSSRMFCTTCPLLVGHWCPPSNLCWQSSDDAFIIIVFLHFEKGKKCTRDDVESDGWLFDGFALWQNCTSRPLNSRRVHTLHQLEHLLHSLALKLGGHLRTNVWWRRRPQRMTCGGESKSLLILKLTFRRICVVNSLVYRKSHQWNYVMGWAAHNLLK